MVDKKRSTSIRGAGDLSGGTYDRLNIYGAGEVHGDVQADGVKIWGAGSIGGATEARTIRVAGSGSFNEGMKADRVTSLGASDVHGPICAKRLKSIGHASVDGPIEADDIRVVGLLECAKSVVAESIHIRGAVSMKGLLSADRVELHLGGPSRCDEIGGERIRVYRRSLGEGSRVLSVLDRLFGSNRTDRRLTASLIEGDDVRLENTTAAVVRGRRIVIGQGCRIRTAEYRDAFEIHPDAVVEKLIQLAPAHGDSAQAPIRT